jgi:hypothetical protein
MMAEFGQRPTQQVNNCFIQPTEKYCIEGFKIYVTYKKLGFTMISSYKMLLMLLDCSVNRLVKLNLKLSN